MSEKFYLTTPIYYVNAAPHIGHTYTTFAADMIRTYKRMTGFNAVLTTGTDEHGQKVERAATKMGKTPQEYTTTIAEEFRTQWEKLGLGIDRFLRTTDPRQDQAVAMLYADCKKNGYIYKGSYTGQYCMFDELYVNDAESGDPCPECGRPTETVTEENLFFRLSAFQEFLLDLYEKQPDFIQPEIRRNEIISFVKKGLKDISISRTTIKWGIPVPDEPGHVFYVWFDALMTYWTAVQGEGLWPADLHLVGKEIIRFHAVYWPAFLKAAGWELPKRIFAHGWLLFDNDKMSKSKGNIVRPEPIRQVMGADPLRYFLFREIPFGGDGNFSYDALVGRYNSDLANGLGNLLSRTTALIRQSRGGIIPASAGAPAIRGGGPQDDPRLPRVLRALRIPSRAGERMGAADVRGPRDRAVSALDAGEEEGRGVAAAARRNPVLFRRNAAHRFRVLLKPILPEITEKIWAQLGMREKLIDQRIDTLDWGGLTAGQAVGEAAQIFPRLDLKETVDKMNETRTGGSRAAERAARQDRTGCARRRPGALDAARGRAGAGPSITIDDFAKVDLRVASCWPPRR